MLIYDAQFKRAEINALRSEKEGKEEEKNSADRCRTTHTESVGRRPAAGWFPPPASGLCIFDDDVVDY